MGSPKIVRVGLLITCLLVVLTQAHIHHHTKQQIQEKIGKTKIMYGATVRIKAVMFNYQYSF